MHVSGSESYNYSPIQGAQKPQELSQEQHDLVFVKIKADSVNAQIDAYVAGTQQSSSQSSSDYTENYTDFASDVRRAKSYAILVENGVDLSSVPGRPSTLPVPDPSELDQDQRDSLRQGLVGIAGYQSTLDQIEAYKAGSENSDSSSDETAQSVENYNQFANDLRRSDALNTYIDYNNFPLG
jgi:hypothetical protein